MKISVYSAANRFLKILLIARMRVRSSLPHRHAFALSILLEFHFKIIFLWFQQWTGKGGREGEIKYNQIF